MFNNLIIPFQIFNAFEKKKNGVWGGSRGISKNISIVREKMGGKENVNRESGRKSPNVL